MLSSSGGAKLSAKRGKALHSAGIRPEGSVGEVQRAPGGHPAGPRPLQQDQTAWPSPSWTSRPRSAAPCSSSWRTRTTSGRKYMRSDLPSSVGPEALRQCTENINRLRRLPGFIETIQKYTEKIFKEILEGSKVLL